MLTELRLLNNIDVPGLNTIDVYERLGGYRALRKALTEMTEDEVLKELEDSGLRGRGGAGFAEPSATTKQPSSPRGDSTAQ